MGLHLFKETNGLLHHVLFLLLGATVDEGGDYHRIRWCRLLHSLKGGEGCVQSVDFYARFEESLEGGSINREVQLRRFLEQRQPHLDFKVCYASVDEDAVGCCVWL